MSYPTDADLTTYLTNAGLLRDSQTLDTDALMKAAVAKWERDTGYKPYWVADDASATARTVYIPQGFKVYLHNGLLSITSIVRVSDNMTLVADDDYCLTEDAPYTEILFKCSRFQYVVITGVWGKTTVLPDDVSLMLLRLGANLATAPLEYFNTRGVSRVQTLGTTFEFGAQGQNYYSGTADAFARDYNKLLLREKLYGMGN